MTLPLTKNKMLSSESNPPAAIAKSVESPRISFSAEFLDDENFICINPHDRVKDKGKDKDTDKEREKQKHGEFEFLSNNSLTSPATMLTADELFFEGKLLPFWQKQCSDKLAKISLKPEKANENNVIMPKGVIPEMKIEESNRMSWFIDEDPSPRPPKCTVLWKELLRLKKQRASSLSPSSSTSSSSSASSLEEDNLSKKDKVVKRVKKGLERTRSAGIKIRPMVNLPVCTQAGCRSNSLPPLCSYRKGSLDR